MSSHGPSVGTGMDRKGLCPSCRTKGRTVKPVTIESLVTEAARVRVGRTDGFRFCTEPSCEVAYFHPETGNRFSRSDVKVRIGQKETSPPRPVCYCFDHTVEEIENEVATTGTSRVPDEIAQKCRQGLDRCEETNPQGACCLGNVRQAVKNAQAKHGSATPEGRNSRIDVGTFAQVGALVSAVVASACCWLPLLLIAVGISGGALSATFEAWRPVALPVTFVLLGLAFYFTYRKPKVAVGVASGAGDACCAVPRTESASEACCPPDKAKGFTLKKLKKLNKTMLWVVTVIVLAFAFFPNYVGYLLSGGDTLAARDDLDKVAVHVDGMTCEACAANIENSLRKVPGVAAAEVNCERNEALVGVPKGTEPPREAILAAIAAAGSYTGRFTDQIRWTLGIEGMTCEGCAASLPAALSKVRGVTSASVSYEQGQARIAAGSSVSEEALRKAVSDAGYTLKSAAKR